MAIIAASLSLSFSPSERELINDQMQQGVYFVITVYIYIYRYFLTNIKNIRFGIRMLIIDSLYNTIDEREKERKGVVCT